MEYHYVQLANKLERQIQAGDYRAGEKLPSLRKLKAATGRSISTIYQAYEELENRGLVEVREKSGFFAKPLLRDILPLPNQSTSPVKSHKVAINVLSSLIQRSLDNPDLIPFGEATAAPSLLPGKQMAAAIRTAAAGYQDGVSVGYGSSAGLEKLRRGIAKRSLNLPHRECGSEIIVTQGCMSGIELCLRSVARPGDIILMESPTFLCYLQLIEDLNMQALEIPADPSSGLDLHTIRNALDEHDIRAALFNPTFQNPLGFDTEQSAKRGLVALFSERGIPIIEDDIYGDLYFGESKSLPLKHFDSQGMVLYCSSFSKALLPDMRLGWLLAGKYREKVKRFKFNNSIACSQLMQHALANFLETGGYDRHLRKLRTSLRRQAADMSQAIVRYFPPGTRISSPRGGLSLWVELPGNVDSLELFRLAEKEDIAIMPGTLCSGSGQYDHCIRLSYGHPWSDRLEQGMEALGKLADSLIKPPKRLSNVPIGKEVVVGLNCDPELLKIEKVIQNFSPGDTEMVLRFHQSISGNILKLIASGELHGGFVFGTCDDDRFVVQHLVTLYLRIVGPSQMADKIMNAEYEDLAELPWIGNPAECPYCQMMDDIFYDRGFFPQRVIAASDEAAILSLIKSGVGLNFMLEDQAREHAAEGSLVVWEQEKFAFPLSFVTLKSEQSAEQVQAIKKVINRVW
ncbi:MAG: aminotransferase class I/II-fold pyridoxal phosphate-dependent enzyme [Thermodesulfobacteriota bacterium]